MLKLRKKIKNILRDFIDTIIFLESKLWRRDNVSKEKLLIIKIDAMGDFLLFSPTLSAYKKLYPKYQIDLMVSTASFELAEFFKNDFDNLLIFNRARFNKSFLYRRGLFHKLYLAGYKVVIYPTYSREINADRMVKMSKAKESIGFNGDISNISDTAKKKNNKFYTKLFESPNVRLSELDRNYEFIEFLGCKMPHKIPQLTPSLLNTKPFLLLKERYIVVHPGAAATYRVWPLDKYVDLLKKINDLFNGKMKFVITGSKKEMHIGSVLKKALPDSVIDLTGKTILTELISVLKGAEMCVGSETSAIHFSAAVGTPTVCIMGGGHFKRFFPYGDLQKNVIVYDEYAKCLNDNWKCGHGKKTAPCIESISVDKVYENVVRFLR